MSEDHVCFNIVERLWRCALAQAQDRIDMVFQLWMSNSDVKFGCCATQHISIHECSVKHQAIFWRADA